MKSFIETVIKEKALIARGDKILIAVSGGVDSMVLLDVLFKMSKELGFSIAVCHLDHMYRADEAIRDANLVKEYCRELDVMCYGYRRSIEKIAKDYGKGFEEMARIVRYQLFDSLMRVEGYKSLATAHHKDDQAETMLMHLFRGAGLDGLQGILAKNGKLIRPFLKVSKEEIYAYAKEFAIPFHEDVSNDDTKFSRNKIRKSLLPLLKNEYDSKIIDHLSQLSELITDDVVVLNEITANLYRKTIIEKESYMLMNIPLFLEENRALKRRLLRFIFEKENGHIKNVLKSHIDNLILWIENGKTGSKMIFHHVHFEHRGNTIKYMPQSIYNSVSERLDYHIIMGEQSLPDWGVKVLVEPVSQGMNTLPNELCLDKTIFENGIWLRSRREKDFIRQEGMKGKSKSIKKLFIDLKLSADEKLSTLLLASSEEVLWVVGKRKSFLAQNEKNTGDFVRITILSL
jgi:tRNA(Ile)-lysidine synthase